MLDIGKTLLSDLLFLLFVATELGCCCEGTQVVGLRATLRLPSIGKVGWGRSQPRRSAVLPSTASVYMHLHCGTGIMNYVSFSNTHATESMEYG